MADHPVEAVALASKPYRCIRPHCPPACSGCNHAIPPDPALEMIARLLDEFARDDFDITFEAGDHPLVDEARALLCSPPKPLDAPRLQQLFGDAIYGAYQKGRQRTDPPPEGHWLCRWWLFGSVHGQQTDDLAHLVRQLAHSLRRAAPNHDLPARAADYLKRKGLEASVLRDAETLRREAFDTLPDDFEVG